MIYQGNEPFTVADMPTGLTISDYWKWAYSDLLSSRTLDILAEFIVRSALRFPSSDTRQRTGAESYDIISPSGRRLEVKAAAYIQAWKPDGISEITFGIAPRRSCHPLTGYESEPRRHSDIFVFCVFSPLSLEASALDLDLWDFYVLPTSGLIELPSNQKTISLSSLLKLKPWKTEFANLGDFLETIEL